MIRIAHFAMPTENRKGKEQNGTELNEAEESIIERDRIDTQNRA
jgi:hypothetical protein